MITIGNYSIEEEIYRNRLVITLPATEDSLSSSSVYPREKRKARLSEEELIEILVLALSYYKEKNESI